MTVVPAVQTQGLGKRYGPKWALRDCTLSIASGSVTALVGPNGAGKTTLLHLAIGLSEPSAGEVRVLGWSPREQSQVVLPRVGFVAQDHPLYRGFTLLEMLKVGRKLNPHWDDDLAPPAMLEAWLMPLEWTPRSSTPQPRLPARIPLPGRSMINGANDTTFHRPVRVGDRLSVSVGPVRALARASRVLSS